MAKMSRRDFLKLSARASALAFFSWPRSLPLNTSASQSLPSVSVAEGTSDDTAAQILQTALDGLGGIGRFVKPGQTVAIKPNATWAYAPKTASSTDPDFLTAVIQAVQAARAGRIIVMDHCSIEPGAEDALRINGIGQLVKDLGIEHIFPDRFNAAASTYTNIDLPQGKAYQNIRVIKDAVEADVRINLAVAKTHNVTKFTMCLKHMMGFLQQPGLLHSNLEQGIADLSSPSSMQAQLHILEAIRVRIPYGSFPTCAGPETDVTNPLVVARRNKVIAGIDPVLVDAFGCVDLFDIQPEDLTHVLRAHESGCGDMDVEAALVDGRLRVFKVGAPVLDPTTAATPAAAAIMTAAPATSAPSKPTAIVLPPSEPVAQTAAESGLSGANPSDPAQIVSLGPLLNWALIPAAAVITGAGLAILTRMRRKLPKKSAENGDPQDKPENTTTGSGNG